MVKRNMPEILNKILKKSKDIYRQYEDLGIVLFLFSSKDERVFEIPITQDAKQMALEFARKDVEGMAIVGKFDIQEQHLLSLELPSFGMNSIGVAYHSGTEDYFFYTKILRHDLEQGKSFKFSEVKRLTRRDGFQLTEGFLKNLFPTLH